MKIAIASSGLGHVFRGIETWADDTGTALAARGVDVTLFKGGGVAERRFEQVVRCAQRNGAAARWQCRLLRRLAWRQGYGSTYHIEQQTFARQLGPLLQAGGFDIVHMQDPWLAYRLEQQRRQGRHRAEVILGHGTEEPLEFLKFFAHVQELAPYYLERDGQQGLTGQQWYAIPNFVNVMRFSPSNPPLSRAALGIPADAFVLLTVAAIQRSHKRVDAVIDEVRRWEMANRRVHLIVAGAREAETAAVVRYGREQLGERITFLENFDRRQMPGLYRLADVMVHGSLVEMMPIALLEATASGLPVVAHRWPVIEWIVGDGGTCVDATQPGNLATALAPYLNAGYRQAKAEQARRRAVRTFSEQVVIEQMLAMYKQVLGQR